MPPDVISWIRTHCGLNVWTQHPDVNLREPRRDESRTRFPPPPSQVLHGDPIWRRMPRMMKKIETGIVAGIDSSANVSRDSQRNAIRGFAIAVIVAACLL